MHRKLNIIEDISFDELVSKYSKEYIPNSIIQPLLKSVFPSSEIVHSYSDCHKVIKLKIDELLIAPIKNWEYNRSPDLLRCPIIAKYIYSSQKPLDCMLYMSFNNNKKCFDIIDGIHRYTALSIIKKENSKPIDLITPGDFGSNYDARWLYESYIFLNIRFNSSDGELLDLFKSLNKSCPVADIYIRDTTKEKREIIENIANQWQIKYKAHFTNSLNPNRPNTNRNLFIELLEKMYDKYEICDENKDLLEYNLNNLNTKISFLTHKNVSTTIMKKCTETGCWLFIYPNEKLYRLI